MATRKAAVRRTARPLAQKPQLTPDEEICFTIMPYGNWPDLYYEQIYVPAIMEAGLIPRRADDIHLPGAITHGIWILTSQARVILADLTGKNPNVFYELGLGHASAKPAILVTDSAEDVPFDLRSLRVIPYDRNQPNWGAELHTKIKTAIKEVLASPVDAVLPTFLIESQIQSLKQELNKYKRGARQKTRVTGERSNASARPVARGAQPTPSSRMSKEDAAKFAQHSLEQRAPRVFIRSMLRYEGFDERTAQEIIDSVPPPQPTPP